jgi:hypothetical protein
MVTCIHPYRFAELVTTATQAVFNHIAHELRLQFLRTTLSTDVQCTLEGCQFLIPRRKMHEGNLALPERGPHDPPAFAVPL